MFEVIIASVLTGRVVRKTFEDSQRADHYLDQFFTSGIFPRLRRNFRVEVHARLGPAPQGPAARPVPAPTAA
jgi:hypothetical protein